MKTDELSFIYDKSTNKFGIACNSRNFVTISTQLVFFQIENRFTGHFEKIISAHWMLSPVNIWTRIKIYAINNIVSFSKLLGITTHICNQYCIISAKYLGDKISIQDSICKQAKNNFVRVPSGLDVKISSDYIRVLLEFAQDASQTLDKFNNASIRFEKSSSNTKAAVRATEGSVGYDLFSAAFKFIPPQKCDLVATDIALILPPGVYLRIAPRSSLALKIQT